MNQSIIYILTDLKEFLENIVAGTQDEFSDSSEDIEKIKDIDKCIKWITDEKINMISERGLENIPISKLKDFLNNL